MGTFFRSTLVAFGLLMAGMAVALATEQSQVVKLTEVPVAAQKTILAEAGRAKGELGDIEKTSDDDETWYDVELTTGKRTRSFSVAPDGKLLTWQVFMNEIPVPARQAIHAQVQAAKGKLGDIDRVVEDGVVTFEVAMNKDGKEISFTISRDGKLLSLQVELTETPDAVQKTIRAQTVGGEIKKIEKNIDDEDGEITYGVEMKKAGKKISFSVDANGKLVEPEN
ncbi:MAG: hypothetical protein JWQ04_704 [Pedosphaera sp.]|nr:hypothetical protein [Pedosphaera sp.]